MKTTKEVQKKISDNAKEIIRLNKDMDEGIEIKRNKSFIKRLKKENQLLRQCELYLKTSPREEYLKNELSSLKDKINSIDSHFGEWVDFNRGKFRNLRSAYKTQMGIPRLLLQIKTLKYLIS